MRALTDAWIQKIFVLVGRNLSWNDDAGLSEALSQGLSQSSSRLSRFVKSISSAYSFGVQPVSAKVLARAPSPCDNGRNRSTKFDFKI